MKRFTAHLAIVLILVAAAEALRRAAMIEEGIATSQEQLTLASASTATADADLDASVAYARRIPVIGPQIERAVRLQRAETAYWRGDYQSLAPAAAAPTSQDFDPTLQLVSTNAAYRNAVIQQRSSQALARSLDDVIKGYASVLEAAPDLSDAAYNYEFVARLRNVLASGRGSTAPMPRSPNMQGEEGAPPEGTKKGDFNVIVPLRPDEREDQLDPGSGAEIRRKG
ncbi:MAG: hypothetical protein ABL993_12170 [Vicinamibacterales bacterium]